MKITKGTKPETVRAEIIKLNEAGESAQWTKRSLIADVSIVHGWSINDLKKDGPGYAYLNTVCEGLSKSQFSETRSYAHPKVRECVPDIRGTAIALVAGPTFKGQKAANVANKLVTKLKQDDVADVDSAAALVTTDTINSQNDVAKRREDPAEFIKAKRESCTNGMKSHYTDDSIAAFKAAYIEATELLVVKSSDVSEPVAEAPTVSESVDLTDVLASLGVANDKAALLAAILTQ